MNADEQNFPEFVILCMWEGRKRNYSVSKKLEQRKKKEFVSNRAM